jgi:uncharacterized protein YjbJ (UPF0337 family)
MDAPPSKTHNKMYFFIRYLWSALHLRDAGMSIRPMVCPLRMFPSLAALAQCRSQSESTCQSRIPQHERRFSYIDLRLDKHPVGSCPHLAAFLACPQAHLWVLSLSHGIFHESPKGTSHEQVKGKIKEVAGEVQEHTGKMVGSTEQQAKGHAREFEGKAQKAVGDVKENLKDANKDLQKDLNRNR